MLRSWGLYVALALGLILAAATANPVRVRGADAPPVAFSAERAMADVIAIARAPHPTGSAENDRVRDILIGRLRDLGFSVEVFDRAAVLDGPVLTGAWPHTLVAVRPGRDRAAAPIALMSHYDSVPGSPGAADDAAGVAASLEIARALAAAEPSERDLVLIVTDGEEPGLLGAEAFFAAHPFAKRLGAVLNLETRGSSGPALMFETTPRNGGLIRRYAAVAPRPAANSLMGFIYAHMPNGTDFTPAKAVVPQGLNFAFLGQPFDYHSASATPAHLDRRSLQSMGDQALAVTADLLRAGPPAPAPDAVYFDLFGLSLVAYPAWAGWLLVAAAAGLICLALARLGPGRPRPLALLRGAGGLVLLAVLAALALRFLGRIAPPGDTFYQGRAAAELPLLLGSAVALAFAYCLGMLTNLTRGEGRWRVIVQSVLIVVAIGLFRSFALEPVWDVVAAGMAAIVVLLAFVLLRRPIAPTALWGGALLLALVLAVALQILAPQIAFIVAWPLLLGAALAAYTRLGAEPGRIQTLVAAAAGVLAVAWVGRLAVVAFDGVGLGAPEVLVAFFVLVILVVAPLAIRASVPPIGRFVTGIAGAGALLGAVFVGLHDPASPRTPAPTHLIQVFDLARGQTLRVSVRPRISVWLRSALGPSPQRRDIPGLYLRQVWSAPAPVPLGVAPPPPSLVAVREGDRAVIAVTASPETREVRLSLRGVAPESLTVEGQPVAATVNAEGWLRLRWHAPRGGFRIAFAPPPGGVVDYRAAAIVDGWPAGAAPLPPRSSSQAPWQSSDSTAVIAEGALRW